MARFTGGAAVRIASAASSAKLRVQCRGGAPIGSCNIRALGDHPLPERVGATVQGDAKALCTGPTEWLIVSATLDASALRQQIEGEAPGKSLTLVDLTDGLAALDVSGPAARELLSKGCGLDLHPASFGVGCCARTRFAQLTVVIHCVGDGANFEIYVARSYLAWLLSWLRDAAVEFQGADS